MALLGAENVSVSNLGRVKQDGEILAPHIDSEGYYRVNIKGEGRVRVHRLVASAFIELTWDDYMNERFIVDHINGIKSDNRVENLRWVNASENARFVNKGNKMRRENIVAINLIDKEITKYDSQVRYAITNDINVSIVSKVLHNKRNATSNHDVLFYESDFLKVMQAGASVLGYKLVKE